MVSVPSPLPGPCLVLATCAMIPDYAILPFSTTRFSTMPFSMLRARAFSALRLARYSAILVDNQARASRIFSQEASRMITLTTISGPEVKAPKNVTRGTEESCSEGISTTAFGRFRSCIMVDSVSGGGPNVDCQRTVGSSDVGLQEGLVEPASLLAQDNAIKIYSN